MLLVMVGYTCAGLVLLFSPEPALPWPCPTDHH